MPIGLGLADRINKRMGRFGNLRGSRIRLNREFRLAGVGAGGRGRMRRRRIRGRAQSGATGGMYATTGKMPKLIKGIRVRPAKSGEDISFKYVAKPWPNNVPRVDLVKLSLAPVVQVNTPATAQCDFDSPNQGFWYRNFMFNDLLSTLFQRGNDAYYNQTGTDSSSTSIVQGASGPFPYGTTFEAAIGASTDLQMQRGRQTRMVLSNYQCMNKVINSCSNTLQFDMYFVCPKHYAARLGTTGWGTTSFQRIYDMATMFESISGNNNWDNLYGTTSGQVPRDPNTHGAVLEEFSTFRQNFIVLKKLTFTLTPGQQINISFHRNGKKMVYGNILNDTYLYPGVGFNVVLLARSQIVGNQNSTAVSYGSGQFGWISEEKVNVQVLPYTAKLMYQNGFLTGITAGDQENINPETNAKDDVYDET